MMKQILRRIIPGLAAMATAACSDMGIPSVGGIFNSEAGNVIHVTENKKVSPDAPALKYAASVHINRYADARNLSSPRKIGTGAEYVSGLRGKDIVVDRDVAEVVARAMQVSLADAGFKVTDAQNGNVLFELGGVVKELTYNVKARDEVSIAIETTLKETSTGKVVWSGVVVEKSDRFAGVSGNNRNDVASYLRKELGVVADKTARAISDSLMATRPELFNLTPGAKAIPGVTVQVAPNANTPAPTHPVQQAVTVPAASAVATPQSPEPRATAASGLLLINTRPARAKVYLDGVYYGLSPLRLEMEPGVHALSVKLEGYKTVDEKVSVRKWDNTEMDMGLER